MKQAKNNATRTPPAPDTATEPLLAVDNLYKRFPLHAGLFASYGEFVYALNGITFSVAPQESYGLVGESGSGKTTAARIIASAYTADHGTVTIGGNTVGGEFTSHPAVQYIFQDPAKSLNPRLSVFDILTAGLHYRRKTMSKKDVHAAAAEAMDSVGLSAGQLRRRPIEFSGGQRQRIAIARALIHKPHLLICDEVVSALDLSIRAQIINLLLDLREYHKLTILFISHDLSLVGYLCDRIGVLYRGTMVEEAPAESLAAHRYHPYTERLFTAADLDVNSSRHRAPRTAADAPPAAKEDTPHHHYHHTQRPPAWDTPLQAPPYTHVTPTHRYIKE